MYKEQGIALKEMRDLSKCTLATVCKKLNITSNYLSLIERGQRRPSEVIMYKLSEFYGVNPIQVFSLYGVVPTGEIEKIIDSPSIVDILSKLELDDSFTTEEKEELTTHIIEVIDKILERRRN